MKKRIVSILVVLSTCCVLAAQQKGDVMGRVFVDANGDGRWNKGEKVVRNAGVSDGCCIVWTDRKGRYHLQTDAEFLFPVVPDGYLPLEKGLQNGLMFPLQGQKGNLDIPLVRCRKKDRFRAAIVGDVQVDSPEEAVLARNTVLAELSNRTDLDVMVHMGDLVNDKPSLFADIVPSMQSMPFPVWTVIGNHDLDTLPRPRRTAHAFREKIGSDIGAWFRGKVCFILIDNVEFMEYAVSEKQLSFIRALLQKCPEEGLVVLCQHVPLGWTKNKEALLEVLGDHKVLVLSAHAHHLFRQEWTDNISEVSVGAACGSWWTGERDMWNNPIALQQCGSPRNYFVFDFDGKDYSFIFKGVGLDADIQADAAFIDGKVLVNVYGGGETTKVECRLGDGEWQEMEKKDQLAPFVTRMMRMNKEAGYPTAFSRRTPFRRGTLSKHIWEWNIPENYPQKGGVWHFHVTDTRGLQSFEFNCIR